MEGMIGESHTSLFPKYFPKEKRSRTLGRWECYNIITEYGEYIRIDSYEQLKVVLVEQSIDCYCSGVYDDYNGFPYMVQCLTDHDHANVYCSTTGGIVAISFTAKGNGRRTGNICFTHVWGHRSPTQTFIISLRRLFTDYGVGDHPTPGSLGERGLVFKMKERGLRVHRPNHMMRKMLLKYAIGGRADAPIDTEHIYTELFEEDRRSAYVAECDEVIDPAQTVVRVLGDIEKYQEYYTYFVECEVTKPYILTKSNLEFHHKDEWMCGSQGPLPIRKDGLTYYPEYGHWKSAYFKEEIECAREAGWIVKCGNGYAFEKSSDFMQEWSLELYKLIHSYRDKDEKVKEITDHLNEGMSKLVPLAAIGRFGRKPEKIEIVPESLAVEGDKPIMDYYSDMPIDEEWYIHISPEIDMNALTQIYNHILAKMRVCLYRRMMMHKAYGNTVVATNYDAVYLTQPSQLPLIQELGGWKETVLHHAVLPHSRTIRSDEKTRTPGIMRVQKA